MPNQNTNHIQPSADYQAWLDAWLKAPRYCHYFAVSTEDDKHPMGNWDAPFYSFDEASQFARAIQSKCPDKTLLCIEGVLHVDGAMKYTPNKYWATWQKKHKQRIAELMAEGV